MASGEMKRTKRCDGFTLLELLIALAIFSLVSVMAFSGFNAVQTTSERMEAITNELAKLQTAFMLMQRDLQQAVERSMRDEFGDTKPPFIASGGGFGNLLEFTRAGWLNPLGRQRSNLQRVAYGIKDNNLVRVTWPVIDRTQGTEPRELVIFKGIKSIQMRFFGLDGQWATEWPPQALGENAPPNLPRAAEVTLELEGWGKLIRVFALPSSEVRLVSVGAGNPDPNAKQNEGDTNSKINNRTEDPKPGPIGSNNPDPVDDPGSSTPGEDTITDQEVGGDP